MRLLLLKCQMWCMLLRSTNYFSPFLFRVLLFVDFIYCITKTCRSSETHFHVCRLCRSSWQNGNRANGIIVKNKNKTKNTYIYPSEEETKKSNRENTRANFRQTIYQTSKLSHRRGNECQFNDNDNDHRF